MLGLQMHEFFCKLFTKIRHLQEILTNTVGEGLGIGDPSLFFFNLDRPVNRCDCMDPYL